MKALWIWPYSCWTELLINYYPSLGWGNQQGEQGASWEIISTLLLGQAEEWVSEWGKVTQLVRCRAWIWTCAIGFQSPSSEPLGEWKVTWITSQCTSWVALGKWSLCSLSLLIFKMGIIRDSPSEASCEESTINMSGVYHIMSAHGKLSHIVICQYNEYCYESRTPTASGRHCGHFAMRKFRLGAFIWLRWSGQARALWLAVVGLVPEHQRYSDSSLSEGGKLGI